ncbi:reverse transcriptase domain-containing protein [Tanacetum coccineum]|uniref:Reverse transcriptase domain-containing protein n=1 Tax=Tanacetum coccineum TaxID=301880 RepID=A0ABQ5J8W3_9ASTR
MTFEHLTKEVLVEVLAKRSINNKEVSVIAAEAEESWMTPIYEYLISGLLLEDPKEAKKVRIRDPQYRLIKGALYKMSFLTSWLRCIGPSQAKSIIEEIHEGSCGFNVEPRSMVVKVMKQGYCWPSMYRDVAKMIEGCTQCQAYSTTARVPNNDTTTINTIEHSTKWVEAKPLTTTNGRYAEKFVWENVICGTLLRNSQKETPFTLNYGSEAIIPTAASLTYERNESVTQEKAKRRENKEGEVALIEEAYY